MKKMISCLIVALMLSALLCAQSFATSEKYYFPDTDTRRENIHGTDLFMTIPLGWETQKQDGKGVYMAGYNSPAKDYQIFCFAFDLPQELVDTSKKGDEYTKAILDGFSEADTVASSKFKYTASEYSAIMDGNVICKIMSGYLYSSGLFHSGKAGAFIYDKYVIMIIFVDANNVLTKSELTTNFDKLLNTISTATSQQTSALGQSESSIHVGDHVFFGHYPQTALGNDNTPIEWLVIEVKDGKALLMSRYGLDCQPYNTIRISITWETCSLRKWLNSNFLKKAFSEEEQEIIFYTKVNNGIGKNETADKIFLLSYDEAMGYCTEEERTCTPTNYAISKGAYILNVTNSGFWWLRTQGTSPDLAFHVLLRGKCGGDCIVNTTSHAVRPVLWVDLNSGIF